MSTNEVFDLVGAPVVREELYPHQAWRYEYLVQVGCDGVVGAFGPPPRCKQVCDHTTVWFNGGEVRSMTSVLIDRVAQCGKSALPIIWEHMPDYVKEPND